MNQSDYSVYQNAFETSLDAIVCSDEAGLITLWNPAAEKMFGFSIDEATGCPLTILMSAENQKKHNAGFNRLINTGQLGISGSIVEINAQRKDGSTFPIELSLSSVKTEQGWNFTAIMRDISRRNLAQKESANLNAKIDAMARSISDILYMADADGNVVWWNKHVEDITGLSPQEIQGCQVTNFIVKDDWLKLQQAIERMFSTGEGEEDRAIALKLSIP